MVNEKNKRKISKTTYIALFSYTTLIFIVGLIVGWWFSSNQLSKSEYEQEKIKVSLDGINLKNELIEKEKLCGFSKSRIWEDKVDLGRRVTILEERLGKDDPEVLIEKEIYQLVELRTWLTLRDLKTACNENYTLVLFFYSNNKDDELIYKQSQDQGFILDELYLRNKDSFITFSFDIHNDNPAISTLKDIFNITKAPSLIIDSKIYDGFKSYGELQSIIDNGQ